MYSKLEIRTSFYFFPFLSHFIFFFATFYEHLKISRRHSLYRLVNELSVEWKKREKYQRVIDESALSTSFTYSTSFSYFFFPLPFFFDLFYSLAVRFGFHRMENMGEDVQPLNNNGLLNVHFLTSRVVFSSFSFICTRIWHLSKGSNLRVVINAQYECSYILTASRVRQNISSFSCQKIDSKFLQKKWTKFFWLKQSYFISSQVEYM